MKLLLFYFFKIFFLLKLNYTPHLIIYFFLYSIKKVFPYYYFNHSHLNPKQYTIKLLLYPFVSCLSENLLNFSNWCCHIKYPKLSLLDQTPKSPVDLHIKQPNPTPPIKYLNHQWNYTSKPISNTSHKTPKSNTTNQILESPVELHIKTYFQHLTSST